MKKTVKRIAALAAGLALLTSSAYAAQYYEAYQASGSAPSLKEVYAGRLEIGIPAETALEADPQAAAEITRQCGLLVCEKETRGKVLLNR